MPLRSRTAVGVTRAAPTHVATALSCAPTATRTPRARGQFGARARQLDMAGRARAWLLTLALQLSVLLPAADPSPGAARPRTRAGMRASARSFCEASAEWPQSFAEEFEGEALNTSRWDVYTENTDGQCGFGIGRYGRCDARNVYLEDGSLVLRSDRNHSCSEREGCFNFSSGGALGSSRLGPARAQKARGGRGRGGRKMNWVQR